MTTKAQLLAEAERLTNKSSFSKEDSARVASLIALAQHAPISRQEAALRSLHARESLAPGQPSYAELRSFFAGARMEDGAHFSGGGGATVFRTYSPLGEGTGTAGGDAVPTGFHSECLEAMKAADGLFRAAGWIFTKTGGLLNHPLSDDSSTSGNAAVISEGGPVSQGPNPIFGQLQFPRASLWSTDQLVYSLQWASDAGIDLESYFAKKFALRFARGCGAQFISTLLAGAATGVTTASPTAIAEAEVFNMLESVDQAYAQSPTAGWLMNLGTYSAILQIRTSGGAVPFRAEVDAEGYPLLLTKRVYLSPSVRGISAGHQVAAFGDLSRFIVRSVNETFNVIVYREAYMANMQLATQAFWRLDGQLGIAGANDMPVKVLLMEGTGS
jgi:HK97 family phage major capsid protein